MERHEEKKTGVIKQDPHSIISDSGESSSLFPSSNKVDPRNCWLCEGWTQMAFEVRLPDKFSGCEVASVYLHLSFEDFKPMVM